MIAQSQKKKDFFIYFIFSNIFVISFHCSHDYLHCLEEWPYHSGKVHFFKISYCLAFCFGLIESIITFLFIYCRLTAMATLICGMWEPKLRKISQPKEVSSKKFDLHLDEATWNSWCSTLIQVLKSKKFIIS